MRLDSVIGFLRQGRCWSLPRIIHKRLQRCCNVFERIDLWPSCPKHLAKSRPTSTQRKRVCIVRAVSTHSLALRASSE